MKTPRFLHYLILLLAVWLPLDNAVAGAVIADCPMMSHALENGMAATLSPMSAPHTVMASLPGAMSLHMQASQPGDCCPHCGVCLLLGGAALPSLNAITFFPRYPASYPAAAQTPAPVGVHTHPFRPPIV